MCHPGLGGEQSRAARRLRSPDEEAGQSQAPVGPRLGLTLCSITAHGRGGQSVALTTHLHSEVPGPPPPGLSEPSHPATACCWRPGRAALRRAAVRRASSTAPGRTLCQASASGVPLARVRTGQIQPKPVPGVSRMCPRRPGSGRPSLQSVGDSPSIPHSRVGQPAAEESDGGPLLLSDNKRPRAGRSRNWNAEWERESWTDVRV